MRPRISIRGLVRPSVGPLVRPSVRPSRFVKIDEKWPFTNSKWFRQCWTRKKDGQRRKRDKEGRGTRRKEEQEGKSDEESEEMKRLRKKKWKMKKWLEDASLTSGSCLYYMISSTVLCYNFKTIILIQVFGRKRYTWADRRTDRRHPLRVASSRLKT